MIHRPGSGRWSGNRDDGQLEESNSVEENTMKNTIAMIVLVGIGLGMVGCEKPKPKTEAFVLKGIFDGETYTTHKGSFSVYLKDIGDPATYKDDVDPYGTQERFSFSDKDGNFYGISASREPEAVPDDIFEQYLNKNPALRSVAKRQKTPDGVECLSGLYMQGEQNTGRGQAKFFIVFTKKQMIYDVMIITRAMEKPEQVEEELKYAMERLWSHAAFRDKIEPLPELAKYSDARLQIIIRCAEKAAQELGYGYGSEYTDSPLITITGPEKENPVVMNVFLVKEKEEILYVLEFKSGPEAAAKKMKSMYFLIWDRIMAEEKLSVEKKVTE
jgi:hypothetical protein